MYRKNKKANLSILQGAIITLLIIAVLAGLAGTVLDKVQDTQTTDSAAYNVTAKGLETFGTVGDFLPVVGIIVVVVVIVGLVMVIRGRQ